MPEKLQHFAGQEFTAKLYGYTYVWRADAVIQKDAGGREFLWAMPIKRISGKCGRLRSQHIFFEEYLP